MPDEILNLPQDRQILMISGKTNAPILAHKYPYYTRREMAGTYLANPYHPPLDRVAIQGRFKSSMHKVKYRAYAPWGKKDYPQFQKGFKFVKGYK